MIFFDKNWKFWNFFLFFFPSKSGVKNDFWKNVEILRKKFWKIFFSWNSSFLLWDNVKIFFSTFSFWLYFLPKCPILVIFWMGNGQNVLNLDFKKKILKKMSDFREGGSFSIFLIFKIFQNFFFRKNYQCLLRM